MERRPNGGLKENKKVGPKTALALVLAAVLILSIFELFLANRLATQGEKIREFENQVARIEEENQKIKNEIIRLSSLSNIASRSAKRGLVKPLNIVYLPAPAPLALKE